MPLLTTKLHVPPLRVQMVERPHLLEKLDNAVCAGHRLTLVSAPAGFGKTTLIAEWLQGRRQTTPLMSCAWLSLDEDDNDPARFLLYLVVALQQIDPRIGQAAAAMMQGTPPLPGIVLLTSLINDLAGITGPCMLILDDYHLIQTPAIHELMSFLLQHMPSSVHVIIATREDPPLPLPRMRARGQATDIRQEDLQFTEKETAEFLRQLLELSLSPADVAALHRRTEGWIAGLQLAALSLQRSGDAHRFVEELSGSQRYILDYLIDEVLQRQDRSVQDFLLKTSILEFFTAGLCDAVTGQSDGQEMLATLDRTNLFMVALDESRRWYRYHRLFRDLLRTQRVGLDMTPLHEQAARWYEANGFPDQAMAHALEARDWEEVERLMEEASALVINNGQFATLSRWLDALPEARLRANSSLAALKGWASLAQGQFEKARAWIDVATSLLTPGAERLEQAMVVCLQVYLAQLESDSPKTLELAHRALDLLQDGDPYGLRGAVLSNLASAQATMGDVSSASLTLRELARFGQERDLPISAVSALTSLAWLEHLQGKSSEAVALLHQALELCVDARGNRLPLAGHVHVGLGQIHYDRNELEQAREHLVRGLELSRQMGPSSGVMQAAFTLARIQLLAGERDAALATVAEVDNAAAQLNLPQATSLVAVWEAGFQLAAGNTEAAARWAETTGIGRGGQPSLVREDEFLTRARVLLAQDRATEAQAQLAPLEDYARGRNLVRTLIAVNVLQALAQVALGSKVHAQAHLAEAVRLAAPQGYRRVFLDAGPLVLALLPGVRRAAPGFVDDLLSGSAGRAHCESPARPRQPLIEPLSERELEVLRLLAEGLSNQEIAHKLVISVGTVKTHVHNICGKMAVSNRTQAGARARALGML